MRILKKLISFTGYLLFFCSYFYVLFINLFYAFASSSDNDILKPLIVSAALAAFLPGTICWQYNYIGKLEKRLEELQSILFDKLPRTKKTRFHNKFLTLSLCL